MTRARRAPLSLRRAPPLPVAAFLSPVLWNLNSPDRFDMYSVGILLMQVRVAAAAKRSAAV